MILTFRLGWCGKSSFKVEGATLPAKKLRQAAWESVIMIGYFVCMRAKAIASSSATQVDDVLIDAQVMRAPFVVTAATLC